MKLILNGNINVYYVQTLCMIFFPGEKFGAAEQENPNAPELYLRLTENDNGVEAYVHVTVEGKSASSEMQYAYTTEFDHARTVKMA